MSHSSGELSSKSSSSDDDDSSDFEIECEVRTTQLTTHPFKNMKKIKGHVDVILDCTSVLFPDGKTKIITCSEDCTLQIFNLDTEKREKRIYHSALLYSVHFYEEKQLLMTTDFNGELMIWDIFSPEIRIIKKIGVTGFLDTESVTELWRLTQVSSNLFFCCVGKLSFEGSLFSIEFKEENSLENIKIEEIEYPIELNKEKKGIFCIYKLISEKNTILHAGGEYGTGDNTIKKYNFKTRKHFKFQEKHSGRVSCLTSFINEGNKEIVLSGGYLDRKILFWNLKNGQNFKEIELNDEIYCFLSDLRRNNIFITTGFNDYSLYSLNLKTKKIIKNVRRIHKEYSNCLKWINEESQNKFISCSADRTFNIFELEKFQNKYENEDLKERVNFLRDEEFIQIYFFFENNKKNLFSIRLLNKFVIKNVLKVLLV